MKTQESDLFKSVMNATPVPLINLTDKGKMDKTAPLITVGIAKTKWQSVFQRAVNDKNQAGVYIFWWKINDEIELPDPESTRHWVKGKGASSPDSEPLAGIAYFSGHLHYAGQWEYEPIIIGEASYVPLYVGKSTNVLSRIKQHLGWPASCQLNTAKYKKSGEQNYPLIPRNGTARQFGDGFHFLFRDAKNVQYAKLKYVHLSVGFTDYADFTNRFYTEDYLIGDLRPPFNLDSER